MAKKFFAIFVVILVLASVFGCAPAPAATEQPAQPAQPTAAPVEPTKAAEPTKAPAKAETVMLDYYIVGTGDTDKRPAVEEAINAYIEPLIGAKVTFHIIPWNDWSGKAVTGIEAGEKMDIFFTADWYFYMKLASEGLFTPLNDAKGPNGNLLEQYGQGILKSMNPAYITGTQIDGVNYAVPTNKELSVPWGFVYNATLADEIGFTDAEAAKVKTFKDLDPWLAKAKAARPNEFPFLTDGKAIGFMQWVHGFASSVDDFLVNMSDRPDASGKWDETIVSPIQSDYIKEYLTIARDWAQKGYINPDSALATFQTSDFLNAGKFFIEPMPLKGENIKAVELMIASGNADLKLKEIYGEPKTIQTNDTGGSMLAIPAVSEHPVEAMKLINLMHTDSKLINMMLYGVEGTMWTVDPDGRVNVTDSAWVGAHPGAWVWGDVLIQKVSNKEDPKKNQMLMDYSKDALPHPSLGFRFRTEPVAAEITALQSVVDGMQRALFTGNVDPSVELPKYIQGLKDAGLDKVKAEIEKQYADWKAKKGQ